MIYTSAKFTYGNPSTFSIHTKFYYDAADHSNLEAWNNAYVCQTPNIVEKSVPSTPIQEISTPETEYNVANSTIIRKPAFNPFVLTRLNPVMAIPGLYDNIFDDNLSHGLFPPSSLFPTLTAASDSGSSKDPVSFKNPISINKSVPGLYEADVVRDYVLSNGLSTPSTLSPCVNASNPISSLNKKSVKINDSSFESVVEKVKLPSCSNIMRTPLSKVILPPPALSTVYADVFTNAKATICKQKINSIEAISRDNNESTFGSTFNTIVKAIDQFNQARPKKLEDFSPVEPNVIPISHSSSLPTSNYPIMLGNKNSQFLAELNSIFMDANQKFDAPKSVNSFKTEKSHSTVAATKDDLIQTENLLIIEHSNDFLLTPGLDKNKFELDNGDFEKDLPKSPASLMNIPKVVESTNYPQAHVTDCPPSPPCQSFNFLKLLDDSPATANLINEDLDISTTQPNVIVCPPTPICQSFNFLKLLDDCPSTSAPTILENKVTVSTETSLNIVELNSLLESSSSYSNSGKDFENDCQTSTALPTENSLNEISVTPLFINVTSSVEASSPDSSLNNFELDSSLEFSISIGYSGSSKDFEYDSHRSTALPANNLLYAIQASPVIPNKSSVGISEVLKLDLVSVHDDQCLSKTTIEGELYLSSSAELDSVKLLTNLIKNSGSTKREDFENGKKLPPASPTKYESDKESIISYIFSIDEDFEERSSVSTASSEILLFSETSEGDEEFIEDVDDLEVITDGIGYSSVIGIKNNRTLVDCSSIIENYLMVIQEYVSLIRCVYHQTIPFQKLIVANQLDNTQAIEVVEELESANYNQEFNFKDSIGFEDLLEKEQRQDEVNQMQEQYENMERLKEQFQYNQQTQEFASEDELNQLRWKTLLELFDSQNDVIFGDVEYYWCVDGCIIKIEYMDDHIVQFINEYTQVKQNKNFTNFNGNNMNQDWMDKDEDDIHSNQHYFNSEEYIHKAFNFDDDDFEYDIAVSSVESPIEHDFVVSSNESTPVVQSEPLQEPIKQSPSAKLGNSSKKFKNRRRSNYQKIINHQRYTRLAKRG